MVLIFTPDLQVALDLVYVENEKNSKVKKKQKKMLCGTEKPEISHTYEHVRLPLKG